MSVYFPQFITVRVEYRTSSRRLPVDSLQSPYESQVVDIFLMWAGPWLSLMSLKKFRGPRYVADLGGGAG